MSGQLRRRDFITLARRPGRSQQADIFGNTWQKSPFL
jgi:hypothetical protein